MLDNNYVPNTNLLLSLYSGLIYLILIEQFTDVFVQFNPLNKPYKLFNVATLLGMCAVASMSIYTSSLFLLSFLSPTSLLYKFGAPIFCGAVTAVLLIVIYKIAMRLPTTSKVMERK